MLRHRIDPSPSQHRMNGLCRRRDKLSRRICCADVVREGLRSAGQAQRHKASRGGESSNVDHVIFFLAISRLALAAVPEETGRLCVAADDTVRQPTNKTPRE